MEFLNVLEDARHAMIRQLAKFVEMVTTKKELFARNVTPHV